MAFSPAHRRLILGSVLVVWTALTAAGAALCWFGLGRIEGPDLAMLMWGTALLLLSLRVPQQLLARWRCRRAAGLIATSSDAGSAVLVGWPGVRETQEKLTVRVGSSAFRPWALALGLAASAYLAGRVVPQEGLRRVFDQLAVFSPAVCGALLSALWGPSGWTLAVETARVKSVLTFWRPLRRKLALSVSLPTIQGVQLLERRGGGYRAILIKRAKGVDWKLSVPYYWPPRLTESLARRLAHLAGVEFGGSPRDHGQGHGPEPPGAPAAPDASGEAGR